MGRGYKLSEDYFGFKGNYSPRNKSFNIKYVNNLKTHKSIHDNYNTNNITQVIRKNKLKEQMIGFDDVFLAGYVWGMDNDSGLFSTKLKNIISKEVFSEIQLIDGEFSGGVISKTAIVLFRNVTSLKNIYYLVKDNTLYFSTSFMDLYYSQSQLNIEKLSILCWGGDVLPFEDVKGIQPGEMLIFDESGINIRRFDYLTPQKNNNDSIYNLVDEVRCKIQESVRKKLIEKKQIGIILSGGIDSSVVLAALKSLNYESNSITTYTWGSNNIKSANDFKYVNLLHDKISFNKKLIEVGDFSNIDILDCCDNMEFPSNHSLFSWWKEAIKRVNDDKIVYLTSGLGSDAFFDTDNFKPKLSNLNIREKLHFLYHSMGHPLYNFNPRLFKGIVNNIKQEFQGIDNRPIGVFSIEAQKSIENYISKQPNTSISIQNTTLEHELFFENNIIHIPLYLDRSIQNMAIGIDDVYKKIPFQESAINKPLLRAAFINELPKSIYSRVSKSNFEEVIFRYILTNKKKIFSILESSILVKYGILNNQELRNVFNNNMLIELYANPIIVTSMIELWLRKLINKKGSELVC